MKEFELSIFWVLVSPFFFIWALGVFLIIKGWSERKEEESREVLEEKETQPDIPETTPLDAKEKELETEEELEVEVPSLPAGGEEFYQEFGKANVVEFPATYVSDKAIEGLDGAQTNPTDFAKSCYRQIGFRCINTIFAEEKNDRVHKVSIFDLVCDHYISDEEAYINFFGENKEKFQDEIASLKSNPEFIYENMKQLSANYKDLPQLLAWNDKELFLVYVKSKNSDLTQTQISWLRESVIKNKLFKVKIFKIVEKKTSESPLAPPPPPERPEPKKEPIIEKFDEENDRRESRAKSRDDSKKAEKKAFTKKEIKFLKKHRDEMNNEELAKELGRSVDSVTHKLSRLGISRDNFEWTKTKENFLKNKFKKLSYKKLAKILGTTIPTVRARARKLKLKK